MQRVACMLGTTAQLPQIRTPHSCCSSTAWVELKLLHSAFYRLAWPLGTAGARDGPRRRRPTAATEPNRLALYAPQPLRRHARLPQLAPHLPASPRTSTYIHPPTPTPPAQVPAVHRRLPIPHQHVPRADYGPLRVRNRLEALHGVLWPPRGRQGLLPGPEHGPDGGRAGADGLQQVWPARRRSSGGPGAKRGARAHQHVCISAIGAHNRRRLCQHVFRSCSMRFSTCTVDELQRPLKSLDILSHGHAGTGLVGCLMPDTPTPSIQHPPGGASPRRPQ